MIRKHTRRAAKAAFAISFGVAIVLGGLAGTARPATHAAPTITIGTKNFPEEFILGELYKQALEAKGFKVDYKENIGSTEVIQTALTSGKIDMYPEYTGVIVQDVFHKTNSPKTASATYALAKKLEASKGYTVLNATPFYDTDVLAVTNATAKKYGLKTISDLKKAGRSSSAASPSARPATRASWATRSSTGSRMRPSRLLEACPPTRLSTRARCSLPTCSRRIRRSHRRRSTRCSPTRSTSRVFRTSLRS